MTNPTRYFGLYDINSKVLVWKVPANYVHRRISNNVYGFCSGHLTYVWVQYNPVGIIGLRIDLVQVLTGETIVEDYDMLSTIAPKRFRLTDIGAMYLRTMGINCHTNDIVYPIMIKLWLPDNNRVHIDHQYLKYGFRSLAIECRG